MFNMLCTAIVFFSLFWIVFWQCSFYIYVTKQKINSFKHFFETQTSIIILKEGYKLTRRWWDRETPDKNSLSACSHHLRINYSISRDAKAKQTKKVKLKTLPSFGFHLALNSISPIHTFCGVTTKICLTVSP